MFTRNRGIINYLSILVAAAFLPAVVLALSLFFVVLEREIDVAWSRIDARTTFIIGSVDSQMDALAGTLDALAASTLLGKGDLDGFHRQAQAVTGDRVDAVSLLRPDGVTILNSRVPVGQTPPAFSVPEVAALAALAGRRTVVSDIFLGATSRRPIFAMIRPVTVAGKPMALAVGLFAERFAPLVERTLAPWEAAIVDGKAQDVARFPKQSSLDAASRQRLAELLAAEGRGHVMLRSDSGEALFVAYERSGRSGWGVASGLSRHAVIAPIQDLIAAYAGGALLLVLPGIALAVVLGLRLARSLRSLANFADSMAVGDPGKMGASDRVACKEISLVANCLDRAAAEIAARDFQTRVQRDLAESRAAEIERKSAELSRSNDELQQFAYVASHDLREPLRMVTSFLELLRRRLGDGLDKDSLEFIGFACDGARRMDTMIQDLLEYSRIGRGATDESPISLADALQATVGQLRLAIGESGARIVTESPLPTVTACAGHMERLFQNLIGNALKYRSPDRPPVVRIAAGPAEGGGWHVTVTDNGIGIEPQYFEQIFVIFQRLHTGNRRDGTGIGLAVCKKIVEHYGGRIWVTSVPGEGSTFHFTLPAAG